MVINYKAIQGDDKAKGSQLCKSVGDLVLATADIETKPEQPQAMGGSAQEGSTASCHAVEKRKFGTTKKLREPYRCCPEAAHKDLNKTLKEVCTSWEDWDQEPAPNHVPTLGLTWSKHGVHIVF